VQAAVLAVVPVVVGYLGKIITTFRADVKVTADLDLRDHQFNHYFPSSLFEILFLFAFFRQPRTRRPHVAILLGQKPFLGLSKTNKQKAKQRQRKSETDEAPATVVRSN